MFHQENQQWPTMTLWNKARLLTLRHQCESLQLLHHWVDRLIIPFLIHNAPPHHRPSRVRLADHAEEGCQEEKEDQGEPHHVDTWMWLKKCWFTRGNHYIWLVVFNHLEKYESQWEGLSHILWKINNVWNHQPDIQFIYYILLSSQGNRAPYFEPDYVQSENIH